MSDAKLTKAITVNAEWSQWVGWQCHEGKPFPSEDPAMLVPLDEYRRLKRIEKAARYYVTGKQNNWDTLVDALKPLKKRKSKNG